MPSIKQNKDKNGKIISYRFRACVGRDEADKQVWRSVTIERPEGLTPKKEIEKVERLADEWEQSERAKYERTHEKVDKSKITLSNFIREVWWKQAVDDGTHTPNGIQFYKYMSNDIISYYGEKKQIKAIDAESVKKYIVFLQTKATSKNGKQYSDITVKRHYETLRTILSYAHRMRYISENPIQFLSEKDIPKKAKKTIDFLEQTEAQRFVKALDDSAPIFWRTYFKLLINNGLRRGEALALQWRDINEKSATLKIRRNVTPDPNSETKVHIGATKTKQERTAMLAPRIVAALNELKEAQTEKYGELPPDSFIFCSASNPMRPEYPSEPTRWLRKFEAQHNLPQMSPHDLRHTSATLALEAGASLKQVQQLLGHADPQTTLSFYSGISEAAERGTVTKIDDVLYSEN